MREVIKTQKAAEQSAGDRSSDACAKSSSDWARLGQHQPEKLAQRKRIRGAPRNGAPGVQPFEVADQEQPE